MTIPIRLRKEYLTELEKRYGTQIKEKFHIMPNSTQLNEIAVASHLGKEVIVEFKHNAKRNRLKIKCI